MMLRTAWKFLAYDKAKSLGALLGIVISTFLIGQQIGVFYYLTDGMVKLLTLAPEYIWVVDNRTENVNSLQRLDTRLQYEIGSLAGVEKVHPLFVGSGAVQYVGKDRAGIALIGVQPPDFVGAPAKFLDGVHEDLLPDGAISVDVYDTRVFPQNHVGATFEINNRKAYVAARTKGERGFGRVFVFTTIDRARGYNNAGSYAASAFLVKTAPGTSPKVVVQAINDNIYGARAWLGEDFMRATLIYNLKHTPIVTAVLTMVVFAFIAGFFVVGLTLYSSAIDRMKDYGTMKAIGATNWYIRRLIYIQALVFGVAGYLIGQALIHVFKIVSEKEGLLIRFPSWFQAVFFLLICGIALGGAAFASRRITRLEPAEVFRF